MRKLKKWISHLEKPRKLKFVIEESVFRNTDKSFHSIQFYLYVYDINPQTGDFYPEDKFCDCYLQDTLEVIKDCALDKFDVPFDSWQEIDPVE